MSRAGSGKPGAIPAGDERRSLRALAHPVRVALVEELSRRGQLTATTAARLLGTTPANCSFHLRQLAKYGLVVAVESSNRREHPWRLSSSLDEGTEREKRMAMGRILGQVAGVMDPGADIESVQFKAGVGYLSEEELSRINALIDSLLASAERRASGEEEPPPGADQVSLIFLRYPVGASPSN